MRIHLIAAARRRAALMRDDDESGFMLIYVLVITTLITMLVSSALVVTSSNIIPAVRATYNQAAESAARGGIQAFLAYINTHCPDDHASTTACTLPSNYDSKTIYTGNGYTASYTWTATKGASWFRVASKGTVQQGGLSVSKTLMADVAGGASSDTLDFGVVTGFETESSTNVLWRFPERYIALDASAIAAAGVPVKGGRIHWSGSSPGVAAGKVAVCNAPYSGGSYNRANTPPPNAPNPYVDWSESGLNGNNYTNYQPCQVAWGHYTQLLEPENPADGIGGYFTKDAMLLSNSWPGGTGPLFNQPVSTMYRYQSGDGPCGTPGQTYRSFNLLCAGYAVEVGGSPAPSSKYGVSWVQYGPRIPSNAVNVPAAACVYNGPTRIKLNGDGTAVVTSPQTTPAWIAANASTRPAQCYAGAGGSGLSAATISFVSPYRIYSVFAQNDGNPPPTTPAIAHSSSGWPVTGQKLGATASTANSVFYMTAGTAGTTTATNYTITATDAGYAPAVGDNPSSHSDGAWKPQWNEYDNDMTCSTSTNARHLEFYNCFPAYLATRYPDLKTAVQNELLAHPTSYQTTVQLQTYLTTLLSAGNSADAANGTPTYGDNRSHRWKVSVVAANGNGCTASSSTTGPTTSPINAPAKGDAFFANTDGTSAATVTTSKACYQATVTLQVGQSLLGIKSWGDGGLLGLGIIAGSTIPQFTTTFTGTLVTTTTTVTPAVSSFPSMDDVTQYSIGRNGTFDTEGPGDLYVEGNAPGSMAFLAQNDVILTGSMAPADPPNEALEIVGQDQVRLYHPVKCKVTDATAISNTSPGFCPNDITGLYTGVPPAGYSPNEQYINLRPDLTDPVLRAAAVFALGNAPESITCPQPPQGGGVCGGEFSTDNYNRGTSLGSLKIIGSLAMAHHGPLGEEWDIPDVTGLSARPYSGYQYVNQYQNLKTAIIALNHDMAIPVLSTTTSTSAMWHIVSFSAGQS